MPSGKTTSLLSKKHIQFYDPDSILHIISSVARGYVIILAGGIPTERALDRKGRIIKDGNSAATEKTDAIVLGFLALTEGNVIDTCFGVSLTNNIKGSLGMKHVQEIKDVLVASADADDSIRNLAVLTYRGGFEIILEYQEKLRELNCFTRCFQYRRVVRDAREALEMAFAELEDRVKAATRLEI
jgi:hypothetical protein